MLFKDVFDRFVEQSPICVMARGLMERALAPKRVDALFEKRRNASTPGNCFSPPR